MCVCTTETENMGKEKEGGTKADGFGISVNLERYFGDERRRILIWMKPKEFGTVANFSQRLRSSMMIFGPLCLLKDGHLLPPAEDCRLIQPGDVIQVIPLSKDFNLPLENENDASERRNAEVAHDAVPVDKENLSPKNNDSIEKESKKKKRKKQKEVNSENAIPIETRTVDKNMKDDDTHVKFFETVFTTMTKLQDICGKDQRGEDNDGDAKSKNVANKDHININGVTDGRITKRKRVRVRKNKQNKQIDTNISDNESVHSHSSSSFSTPVNAKNSHLRFSSNDMTIMRNSMTSNGISDKPRIVHAIKLDDHCSVKEEEKSVNKSESTNSLDVIMKEIDKYPLYKDENPKENDIIVFKMLKMDENYAPTVSKPILGKIVKFSVPDMNTSISILDGHKECSFPLGKFDMPTDEDENQPIETIDVLWNQMIETRMVNNN